MISHLLKSTFTLFISLGLVVTGFGQSRVPDLEIGVTGNAQIYHGDLTTYKFGDRKTPGYGGSIFLTRRLISNLYVRGNLTAGVLKGDDGKYAAPNYIRNVKFETPMVEISGMLLQPLLTYDQSGKIINTLYIMGGVGYTMLDHNIDYSQTRLTTNDPDRTKFRGDREAAKPQTIPVTLAGFGIRRTLTTKIDLTVEAIHRFTTTDFLDGVSYSGDDTKNDSYHTVSFGLIYTFGVDNKRNHYDFRSRGRNRLYCPAYR